MIKDNEGGSWNADFIRDASGLFHSVISFQLITCLVVVLCMLEITRPLTKQLHSIGRVFRKVERIVSVRAESFTTINCSEDIKDLSKR